METSYQNENEDLINYDVEDIDQLYLNGLGYVNRVSLEYIVYTKKIVIPFINFDLNDIKFSFPLSFYILSNQDKRNKKNCFYAFLMHYLIILPKGYIIRFV